MDANEQLANNLKVALGSVQSATGDLSSCVQSGLGVVNCYWPYYQQFYPPVYCSHNIGPDEELLLNAIRHSPAIKARLLKAALEECLKEMEKAK